MHGSQKFSQNFHLKPLSNLVKVFDVYLEMSSDFKNYFGCVVGGIFLRAHSIEGVANGLCETLRDGETRVYHCEPETFIYFEMRVRDFGVILEMRVRDLCS